MPRKKKSQAQAKAKAQPAAPLPAPAPAPAARLGTVTLWGEILEEGDTHLKMAVINHGDARDVGLCGTVWIKKAQIYGQRGQAEGYDFVRVNFAYASLLAQSCQSCE